LLASNYKEMNVLPHLKRTIILLLIASTKLFAQPAGIVQSEFVFQEAPFKECHASTIAETPDGLVVAWFGGTKEKNKDVEIWLSLKRGDQWSAPVSVANGIQNETLRHPCWNPVLFQVPDGPLQLYYKVGPNPREWWGMLLESDDHGSSWGDPILLPEGILGPIKNKPVLLGSTLLLSPTSTEHDGWRIHFEYSPDLGKTWTKGAPINDGRQYNAIQPSVLIHNNGKLQLLARSKESRVLSAWSEDSGKTWSDLQPTALPNPNSGTDAETLKDGRFVIVYNHVGKNPNQWGGKRSPLNLAISEDGMAWMAALVLEREKGEFSYPSVIQASDGLLHVVYTWKRERVKHVVIDTGQLQLKPIVDGKWPQ
jgi:predicted neuraminidase